MTKSALICFLDKSGVPEHSFIEGALSKNLRNRAVVYMLTSKEDSSNCSKLNDAIVVSRMHKRRGLGRFMNFFSTIFYLLALSRRVQKKREITRIIVFVRNDPVVLLATTIVKRLTGYELIFQSSFAHEKVAKGAKRYIANLMFDWSLGVDKIMAVSEDGLSRMKVRFTNSKGFVYPLLGDTFQPPNTNKALPITFVYIGTLAPERQIIRVINAFVKASEQVNHNISLTIIGGTICQFSELKLKICEGAYVSNIYHYPVMPRREAISMMRHCDVGLSLVPYSEVNFEMSPTKLTEYMSNGLAVLCSDSVRMHQKLIEICECGVITQFEQQALADAFVKVFHERARLPLWKRNSFEYCNKFLNYKIYQENFIKFLDL